MKLNNRQTELAIALREIVKIPQNESWADFTDFIRIVAQLIEGGECLIRPKLMQKRFSAAWRTYASLCTSEHKRIVQETVGNLEDLERLTSHPNSMKACCRIMDRVEKTYGGLEAGMNVDNVSVSDILSEELG